MNSTLGKKPKIRKYQGDFKCGYDVKAYYSLMEKINELDWGYPIIKEEPSREVFGYFERGMKSSPFNCVDVDLTIMRIPEEDEKAREFVRARASPDTLKEVDEYIEEAFAIKKDLINTLRERKELRKTELLFELEISIEFDTGKETEFQEILSKMESYKELQILNNLLSILRKSRPYEGSFHIDYEYGLDFFSSIGGFKLPLDIKVGDELKKKIGLASIENIGIRLEKSPLGISTIHINSTRDAYVVGFTLNLKNIDSFQDSIRTSLELSYEVASMLVVDNELS